MTPTGRTADGSWEVGVRRTFPLTSEQAWETARRMLADDPAVGEPRSITEGTVARFPYGPDGASTLQLRVLEAASGATIALHHEGLADEAEREAMRVRWTEALERLR